MKTMVSLSLFCCWWWCFCLFRKLPLCQGYILLAPSTCCNIRSTRPFARPMILLDGRRNQQRITAPPIHTDCFSSFTSGATAPGTVLYSKKSDNKNDDNSNDKRFQITDSRNFYETEEESSRKVFNNLLFGQNLGSIVTTAGWTFVAVGFLLNFFGYDYVVKDGRVTIDTIEARQFQKEVRKAMKQGTKQQLQQQQAVDVAGTGSSHTSPALSWINDKNNEFLG